MVAELPPVVVVAVVVPNMLASAVAPMVAAVDSNTACTSDGVNRSNGGNSNGSRSDIGSGGASDTDDGGAGQLPRLEANRLN